MKFILCASFQDPSHFVDQGVEYVPMPAAPLKEADEPIVYVNGKRHILPEGNAETTLLQYLRGAVIELCTDLFL